MNLFGKTRKFAIAILLVVVSTMLFASVSMAAPAAPLKPIKVYLEKEELKFDGEPIALKNVVYVDFRPILEALGFTITYDAATKKITGKTDKRTLEMIVGSSEATLNGKLYTIPHKPFTQNGRLVVPIRFVGEAAGLKVTWHQFDRTVTLSAIDYSEEAVAPNLETLLELLKRQKQLVSAGELKGFLATLDPTSPLLAGFSKQEKILAELTKTTTTFSDLVAKESNVKGRYDITFKTTTKKDGEGFYLEATESVKGVAILGKDGKWSIHDLNTVTISHNKPWEVVKDEATVPSADKEAILAVVNANEKALNDENLPALLATYDAETGLVPQVEAEFKAKFADYDLKTTNDLERIVYFKGSLAYVYVTQKNELIKGTGYTNNRTYEVFSVRKNKDGKWVISPTSQLIYTEKL